MRSLYRSAHGQCNGLQRFLTCHVHERNVRPHAIIAMIGRFLEHSRVFYFRNGADDPIDGEFYIGSADWMYRNLLARVEAVVPIERRSLRERLWEVIQIMLNDQRQAWDMQPDGSYVQRTPAADTNGDPTHAQGTHAVLMNLTRQRNAGARAAAAAMSGAR